MEHLDEGSHQAGCDDTYWFFLKFLELNPSFRDCTLSPYFVCTSDDALSAAAEDEFWPFSCSLICFVQLQSSQYSWSPNPPIELIFWGNALSAWVESAWLWHLVSEFAVRAEPPGEGCESQDHDSEDGSVDLPVRRLGVPATSW